MTGAEVAALMLAGALLGCVAAFGDTLRLGTAVALVVLALLAFLLVSLH